MSVADDISAWFRLDGLLQTSLEQMAVNRAAFSFIKSYRLAVILGEPVIPDLERADGPTLEAGASSAEPRLFDRAFWFTGASLSRGSQLVAEVYRPGQVYA